MNELTLHEKIADVLRDGGLSPEVAAGNVLGAVAEWLRSEEARELARVEIQRALWAKPSANESLNWNVIVLDAIAERIAAIRKAVG